MPNYKQYEQDERANLRRIIDDMDRLYSEMGGRDSRPERKAPRKCMRILQAEVERLALLHWAADTTNQTKEN